jgi:DNA (cytosine-5)-methyltransferase 1
LLAIASQGGGVSRTIRAADLFCGAGGTSQGAEQSGAARVVCAVNHWQVAVETHSANFPHAKHINSRLDQVNPGECPKIDLLFASPECTHHSIARGGRPTSDQQRAGAWDLMRWIEYHRPTWIVVENVPEFTGWGPVGDNGQPLKRFKGKFFDAWLMAMQSAGYRADWRLLNAADYGAATSRTRMFVVARKGNRRIHWPDPTHAERVGGELPGMGLSRWRAAAEIIDWSIPCRSVFLRSKPLKDNTLYRIEAGLRKFVGPFVALLRNNSTATGIGDPLSTITCGGRHHGLVVPFQFKAMGNSPGLTKPIDSPLPTIVARENHAVCVPFLSAFHNGPDSPNRNYAPGQALPTLDTQNRFGVAVPFLKPNFNERDGQQPRSHDPAEPLPTVTSRGAGDLIVPYLVQLTHGGRELPIDKPLRTVTTANRGEQALAVPLIVNYYSNGKAQPVTDPLCTISTRDRCGLAVAVIETAGTIEPRTEAEAKLLATMRELGVADVGFRMLVNAELALAQGFPASYVFHGNKGQVTKQIGNAVCPDVAAHITLALAGAA